MVFLPGTVVLPEMVVFTRNSGLPGTVGILCFFTRNSGNSLFLPEMVVLPKWWFLPEMVFFYRKRGPGTGLLRVWYGSSQPGMFSVAVYTQTVVSRSHPLASFSGFSTFRCVTVARVGGTVRSAVHAGGDTVVVVPGVWWGGGTCVVWWVPVVWVRGRVPHRTAP